MVVWLAVAASAQVNTESLAGQPTTAGPAFALSGGVSVVTGNVSSLSWNGAATGLYVTLFPEEGDGEGDDAPPPYMRDRVLLYGAASNVRYSGERVDQSAMSHLRYTRMWVRRLGTEAFAQLQSNPFQSLRERLLLGGGLRFDAVHERHAGVWGGVGAMFERETVWQEETTTPTGTDTEPRVTEEILVNIAVRGTSYLTIKWDIVPDHLIFSNTAYFQPKLDDSADFRVLSEGLLTAKVNASLSLGTTLVVRHDTRPPDGVQTTDTRLGSALTVSWKPTPKQP